MRKGRIGRCRFVRSALMREITWRVSKHYTHSNRQPILFSVIKSRIIGCPRDIKSCRMRQWSSKMFDTEMFAETFKKSSTPTSTAKEKSQMLQSVMSLCQCAEITPTDFRNPRGTKKSNSHVPWSTKKSNARMINRKLHLERRGREDYRQDIHLPAHCLNCVVEKNHAAYSTFSGLVPWSCFWCNALVCVHVIAITVVYSLSHGVERIQEYQ